MDRLEAAMSRIGYEWERGIERGDQVKNWTKAIPFWWAIIGWPVIWARRGVMVYVIECVEMVGEGGTIIQWLKKCPHVSQILKDSVIAQHILNIIPNAWWLT